MLMSSAEFEKTFEIKLYKVKSLNVFSDNFDGHFVTGTNTFVKKSTLEEELDSLMKQVPVPTLIYHQLNRNHNMYSYYYVLGFTSSDKTEIKKLIRRSRLKAFL